MKTQISKWIILVSLLYPTQIFSQSTNFSTEQRFQDLFITAGYATAYGAAMGAAFLGLTNNPASKTKYIAIGASLGFISGSILGTYVAFSPILQGGSNQIGQVPERSSDQPVGIDISPVWDLGTKNLKSLQANWLIAKF